VFTGAYTHAVDGKGRIAVPARFREELDGEVVAARWIDACLALFPKRAWDEIAAKLGALPMTDPTVRLLQRRLFGWAFETEVDKQGRMLLPQNLREAAGLEDEAVILGMGDHVEIWAPSRWSPVEVGLADDAAFAEAVSKIGI